MPGLDGRFELGRAELIGDGDGRADRGHRLDRARGASRPRELLARARDRRDAWCRGDRQPAPLEDDSPSCSRAVPLALTVESALPRRRPRLAVAEVIAERGLRCRLVRCGVRPHAARHRAGASSTCIEAATASRPRGWSRRRPGARRGTAVDAAARRRETQRHHRLLPRRAGGADHARAADASRFAKLGVDYEIIFVNDASPDNAREVLADLAARDPHVVVINHSRNFGSQSAFTSGMRIATGDAVVLLDGDLQDPPELIEHSTRSGWRATTSSTASASSARRPGSCRLPTRLFYRLFRAASYVADPAGRRRLLASSTGAWSMRSTACRRTTASCAACGRGSASGRRACRTSGRSACSDAPPTRCCSNLGWARKAILSFSYAPLDLITWLALTDGGRFRSSPSLLQVVCAHLLPGLAPHGFYDAVRLHSVPRRHPVALPEHHRRPTWPTSTTRSNAARLHRREHPEPARGLDCPRRLKFNSLTRPALRPLVTRGRPP